MALRETLLKAKDYAGAITAIAGALGIMYGVHVWIEKKNGKIENAVSKQEVEQMLSVIEASLDNVRDQNAYIIEQQDNTMIKVTLLNKNVGTLRNEMIRQIKQNNDLTEAQKIDDILRIVEGIKIEIEKKEDSLQYKIRAVKKE